MPLSKARNRNRMRVVRATQVQPNPVQPTRLVMDKNKIIGVQPKPRLVQPKHSSVQPKQVAQADVKPNPIVKPDEFVIIGGVRYKKPTFIRR